MTIARARRLLDAIDRDPSLSAAVTNYDELLDLCTTAISEWEDADGRASDLEEERDALQEKLDAAGGAE